MTNIELKKFQIIKALHMIVKCANNEELANADLMEGIEDGGTPEEYVQEITENFTSYFSLYAGLACEAMRNGGDGLYIDGVVYKGDDYYKNFD